MRALLLPALLLPATDAFAPACAWAFGGKERVKDLLFNSRRQPGTVIAKIDAPAIAH